MKIYCGILTPSSVSLNFICTRPLWLLLHALYIASFKTTLWYFRCIKDCFKDPAFLSLSGWSNMIGHIHADVFCVFFFSEGRKRTKEVCSLFFRKVGTPLRQALACTSFNSAGRVRNLWMFPLFFTLSWYHSQLKL